MFIWSESVQEKDHFEIHLKYSFGIFVDNLRRCSDDRHSVYYFIDNKWVILLAGILTVISKTGQMVV